MKVFNVKNPLTVIAIFASLTEVVGTAVTPFLDGNNQTLFLYFIIGFPTLLIISFFVTLNFNHKVLYSPSDFDNSDTSIVSLFYGKSEELKKVEKNKANSDHSNSRFFDFYQSKDHGKNKPYMDFANIIFRRVISLIPEDKLELIWCDWVNYRIYFCSNHNKE